jgi:hypothetical protein
VCHQRFHLIIAQVGESFHLGFVIFLDAFFDGFGHFVVFHIGLDFSIGVILNPEFLAHLGFADAIFAMALSAVLGPDGLGVGGSNRNGACEEQAETDNQDFLHTYILSVMH